MAQGKQNEVVGTINHMKKKGSLKLLVVVLLIGVLLFVIGSVSLFDDKNESVGDGGEDEKYSDFYEYKELLEDEIQAVCESVSGIRSARVVIFFDGLGTSVYAQNTQVGSNEKNEYVIIGSGSSSHALYLGEALPRISGIGVVCRTSGNQSAKNEICALLAATYGISMRSIISTLCPSIPREAATLTAEVVLPTPPFWLENDIIFPNFVSSKSRFCF